MLNRRTFLKTSALLGGLLPFNSFAGQKSVNALVRPPALNEGDTIGLITPASPLFEYHQTVIEVREKLHNLGYQTRIGKNTDKNGATWQATLNSA